MGGGVAFLRAWPSVHRRGSPAGVVLDATALDESDMPTIRAALGYVEPYVDEITIADLAKAHAATELSARRRCVRRAGDLLGPIGVPLRTPPGRSTWGDRTLGTAVAAHDPL